MATVHTTMVTTLRSSWPIASARCTPRWDISASVRSCVREEAFATPGRSLRALAAMVRTTRSMIRCSTSTEITATATTIATARGAPTNHTQKALSDSAASPDGEGEGDGVAADTDQATVMTRAPSLSTPR
jgi:hypothetical protein